MLARKLRHSSRFPHLSYELSFDARGQVVAHFQEHHIFRTYILADGMAHRIDESDRYNWDHVKDRHVCQTAGALAAKLTTRKAA